MPSQRIILGTGLAILLLIGAASIGLDLKSRSDTASVDRALEVLKKISDLRPLMRSAESAARGFAVTGDPEFAREHRDASAAFLSAFDDLLEAVKDQSRRNPDARGDESAGGPPDCALRRVGPASERRRPRRDCRADGQGRRTRRDGDDRLQPGKGRCRGAKAAGAQPRRVRDQRARPAGDRSGRRRADPGPGHRADAVDPALEPRTGGTR